MPRARNAFNDVRINNSVRRQLSRLVHSVNGPAGFKIKRRFYSVVCTLEQGRGLGIRNAFYGFNAFFRTSVAGWQVAPLCSKKLRTGPFDS